MIASRHDEQGDEMRMQVMLGTITAMLALMALTAGSALAGAGGPPPAAVGAGLGQTGLGFTCERATARLARVEARIARIQARLGSGQAKKPERAARFVARLEKRADRIEARMAANNC
jgi:hypothetical protein